MFYIFIHLKRKRNATLWIEANLHVMDIETYEDNGCVVPYLFILKTPSEIFSYYLREGFDIIAEFLNKLDQLAPEDFIEVYTHNINFDGFILIEYFLKKSIPYK